MRKITTLILAVVATATIAMAQEPYTVYCKLYGASFSMIDYGQESLRRNTLVDEEGDNIYFNSMVGALNYMAKRGWRLEKYVVKPYSSILEPEVVKSESYLLLSKEILSEVEIIEGITTRQMLIESGQ